ELDYRQQKWRHMLNHCPGGGGQGCSIPLTLGQTWPKPTVSRSQGGLRMGDLPIADVIELEQLLARYAVGMTKDDVDAVVDVFTPDGTYSAFGDTYQLGDFPTLVAAAPKGLFLVGPPVLELDGDVGRGEQPLCFVEQQSHDMRIGYYSDTYRRTDGG